jgi:hypothetical protein
MFQASWPRNGLNRSWICCVGVTPGISSGPARHPGGIHTKFRPARSPSGYAKTSAPSLCIAPTKRESSGLALQR